MEISIKISDGALVTRHGKRPFKLLNRCPICGEAMRLKNMIGGTCNGDPYYFKLVCSCCETSIITEADAAEIE